MTNAIGAARPSGKAGSKIANKFYDKTATKASKMLPTRGGKLRESHLKFGDAGQKPPMSDKDVNRTVVGAYAGGVAGIVGGGVTAYKGKHGKQMIANDKQFAANSRKISSNNRKLKLKDEIGKSKVYTITDHGTPAVRGAGKSKAPLLAAGAAGAYMGGAMHYGLSREMKGQNKNAARKLSVQRKKIAAQEKQLVTKASERRKNTSAAITGAGATTAGVGLLAGGVPGGKSDFAPIMNAKKGTGNTRVKRAAGTARSFGGAAAKGAPGGILGFRTSAHKGGTYGYKMQEYEDGPKKMKDNTEAFKRGRNAGKIAPEEKIIRHMKGGQKVANAVLIGGAATAAYGATRDKKVVSKSKDSRRDSALVGGGLAGATIAHGGKHALKGQQNYWETSASRDVDRAGKIAPQTAGRRQSSTPGVRTMYPSVSDGAIARNKLLDGMPKKKAEKVGRLRGSAAQGRHFAEVYGNTAKVVGRVRTPSLAVAGVGAAGLASNKKKVQKSLTTSAFGVDHG